MRIRKRKVPLPLSMLSPVPITSSFFSSDPATAPPPPWVQLFSDAGVDGGLTTARSSAKEEEGAAPHPNPTESSISSASPISPSEKEIERNTDNNIAGVTAVASAARKGSLCSTSSSTDHPMGQLQSAICSPSVGAMWSSRGKEDISSSTSRKKSSWFSSSSLFDTQLDTTIVAEGGYGYKQDDVKKPPLNKKRSTGGGSSSRVMEAGSRCSRVNGRGWRCSQPTLVGYSLCEHHLGKGRIRSISTSTTTRQLGSTIGSTQTTKLSSPASSSSSYNIVDRPEMMIMSRKQMMPTAEDQEDDDNESEKDKMMIMMMKKKSKLGSVKARSISSLLELDQPDNAAVSSVLDHTTHHHLKY